MKAIAVDIDGTITDKNRKICVNAINALRKAEDAGYPVILVTGNVLCTAKMVSTMVGTSGGIVCENGGVVYTTKRNLILGDIKKCKPAYELLKSRYDVEKTEFSDLRSSEIAIKRTIDVNTVKETVKNFDVVVYDTKFAIHITDPLVNKGKSLKIIAEDMGITADEIIAIGDSENDLEFLEVAGFKVAVSNADDDLKENTDYVTKKAYGDGAAEAIEKFILNK
ncbi:MULTISPECIES: phosphoglycolate phosphatase [Methanobacterium]|uniref:Phosphoglycolate phosphatase n=1 Tax=Methanobacterium veterum TaxID=408577 RepID=A0A9E4ZYN3_9EURY|nr:MULTISPECIES: phosphoglycolate phosphatase [Methanobacterium]MCZ3365010.1 phosphoglycolate phosphatase [Methanobacterium veterum]MCZ3372765.1 phosphoglycolate phosphatase [Methanobacterium veterum]